MSEPPSQPGLSDVTVVVSDEQSDITVDADRWATLARDILRAEGRTGELTLTFLDRDEMAVLNEEHMGKSGPTDVLSFPLDSVDDGFAGLPGPLLLGDVDSSTDNSVVLEITPTHTHGTQIVPVTELELGATAHLGRVASFSAGYFWSAWHDLGMREDLPPGLSRTDDANILGFDGLFARGEVAY